MRANALSSISGAFGVFENDQPFMSAPTMKKMARTPLSGKKKKRRREAWSMFGFGQAALLVPPPRYQCDFVDVFAHTASSRGHWLTATPKGGRRRKGCEVFLLYLCVLRAFAVQRNSTACTTRRV